MSDLPSARNSQQARQRRHARRRAGAGAIPKKQSALAPIGADESQARISRPLVPDEALALDTGDDQDVPASETDDASFSLRKLTPLTKQILLWGAITGLLVFLLSIGVGFLLGQIAPTLAAYNQHQTIYTTTVCLSDLATLGLLAFGGMRATARMGLPRHGSITGAWSAVVTVLLEVLFTIALFFIFSQQGSLGQDVLSTLSSALFSIPLGFGAGWVGGRYSEWKRNKAKKQQEAALAP